jgi:hypothetical protein
MTAIPATRYAFGPWRRVGVAMVLGCALTIAGCSRSSSSATARLGVAGVAEVSRQGESPRAVSGTRTLKAGDRVRVRDGTATVRLASARQVELRQGSQVELKADGNDGLRPVLVGGDLLALGPDAAVTVEVPGVEVVVNGAARVSRSLNLLIATYERVATVRAGGASITVPALRQAAVPASGVLPIRPTPLEYSPTDSWDERYLADAFDLGNQLATRSRGFTAQLGPTEGRTVGFFRDLLPDLAKEPTFDTPLLNPNRPPGDTLVGAAITLEGKRDSFAARWNAIFAFHEDGAPWGLVALDQGVDRGPLLAAVDGAIRRQPTQFAEVPKGGIASSPDVARPPATATTPTAPPTTAAPVAGSRPVQPTTSTIAPAPNPPSGGDGPLRTGSPVIDNTVNSLVDTLNALLRSLGQRP